MAISATTLVECPEAPNGIQFPTFWYRLPGIETFRICTCCYKEKIAATQYSNIFECFWYTPYPGEQVICNFNTGRAHQLFDYALKSSDCEPFVSFAKRHTIIPQCPGTQGNNSKNHIRWYGLDEITDFTACEACYEDFVSVRAFNQYFKPLLSTPISDQTRTCHLAIPFIKRCLEQYSPSRDWSSFVNAAKYRLTQVPCTGQDIQTKAQNWYTPLRLPQLMVCETCFLDEILLQPSGIADNFADYDPRKDPLNKTARCAFSCLSVQVANEQLLDRDFSKWLQVMHRITMLPPCGEQVQNGEFYMLVHPLTSERTDYGMCESCYVGCIETSNLAHLFRRTTYPGLGWCEFSSLNDRRGQSVVRLTQAILTNNATELTDYATRCAMIHPCARDGPNSVNCHWWGTDDFVFCAECYDILGKDSYFSPTFKHQGTFDDRPEARCDMWSEEIRRAYHYACQRRDINDFLPVVRDWQKQQQRRQSLNAAREQARVSSQTCSPTMSPVNAQTDAQEIAATEPQTPPKESKSSKFARFLGGVNEVLSGINAGLEAQQAQQQAQDNTQYQYVAYSPQYDGTNSIDASAQTQSHSLLNIFTDSMNAINAQNQAQAETMALAQAQQAQLEQAAASQQQQYQAYHPPASNGNTMTSEQAWQLSQQMAARHQMNMGILQTNAGMFGMHNAAMQGITSYGSDYNRAYDSTYQSHLNGYNFGQQNMTMGMTGMM